MPTAKIAVSMDSKVVAELDRLVHAKVFASRSQAIQVAVAEKLARLAKTRLHRACAKVDRLEEQALAEVGLDAEAEVWPAY